MNNIGGKGSAASKAGRERQQQVVPIVEREQLNNKRYVTKFTYDYAGASPV